MRSGGEAPVITLLGRKTTMPHPPILRSIQVGLPRYLGTPGAPDPIDQPWESGFFKAPVAGPLRLGRTNLARDGQADLRNHGGPDKAVLAYAAAHYPAWREELGRIDLPHGAFGENFTVDGLDEASVCIGDTYQLGAAHVQVSQPRQPCWKLGRRWRMEDLPSRVLATGRSGWYLRVLEEGMVEPGLPMVLMDRPFPEWTVSRVASVMRSRQGDPASAARLAACPLLSAAWRQTLSSRAR